MKKAVFTLILLAAVIAYLVAGSRSQTESVEQERASAVAAASEPGTEVAQASNNEAVNRVGPAQEKAGTGQEVVIDVPSIDDYKWRFRTLGDDELKKIVAEVENEISQRNLVKRANTVGLDQTESQLLADGLNRKAAAQIVLIERKLAEIESWEK